MAWKRGVKSLYYCRSKSIQRAESADGNGKLKKTESNAKKYDECLACQ
jgi:ribonucleoside-diphosphate reductase alpha chain